MKLTVKGDVSRLYLQTLCMTFFPGETFGEKETETEGAPCASVTVSREPAGIYAESSFSFDGRTETREAFCPFNGTDDRERTARRAAGESLYRAGCALTGITPPWGTLTGVRPSKIAEKMIFQTGDNSEEEIPQNKVSSAIESLQNDYFLSPDRARLACQVACNEAAIAKTSPVNGCSLYVSIPFCPTRCAYCSFISYASEKLFALVPAYLDALCREIEEVAVTAKACGLTFVSAYIGGGTPTFLNAGQLEKLLSSIGKVIDVPSLFEFTLEGGRPDTITKEKLDVAKRYGVTRVSVNPQTLNDEILRRIGRDHTTAQFYDAFRLARESGIEIINTDLIAGLPGESSESFSDAVDGILALRPENITVHSFSVKKSADLRRENAYRSHDPVAEESVRISREKILAAGYEPYYMYRQKNTVGNLENVGYALPGTMGYYNVYMMREVHTVFAAGAGAVTKLVAPDPADPEKMRIERIFSPKYPYEYLEPARRNDLAVRETRARILSFFGQEGRK